MHRSPRAPIFAVLIGLSLFAIGVTSTVASATPTDTAHAAAPQASCPVHRILSDRLNQEETLYFRPQSATQTGIGVLTISSLQRTPIVAEIEDARGGLRVQVFDSPERFGSPTARLTLRIDMAGITISNLSSVPIKATLTITPRCS